MPQKLPFNPTHRTRVSAAALIASAATLFLGTALSSASAETSVPLKAVLPDKHFEILDKHCLGCHDAVEEEGGINLEDLSFEISRDIPTAETWQKVLAVLNEGEMPPKKKKPLSAEDKTVLLRDLSVEMAKARRILSDSGGQIVLRRLNRREYANTLEALLGFAPDVADLPPDSGAGKFDTIGANLFFSSDRFEQYRKTAAHALRSVLELKEAKEPLLLRTDPEIKFFKIHMDHLNYAFESQYSALLFLQTQKAVEGRGEDFQTRESTTIVDAPQAYKSLRPHTYIEQAVDYVRRVENHTGAGLIPYKSNMVSVDTPKLSADAFGSYTLRVRAGGYLDQPEFRRYIEYGFTPAGSRSKSILGQVGVRGTLASPQVIEIPIVHPPNTPGVYFVQHRDYHEKSSRYANNQRLYAENGIGLFPAVWVDYLELEGQQSWPPDARRFLPQRSEGKTEDASARRSIAAFAAEAFRGRPVDPEFLDALVDRYRTKRSAGETELEALIDAYSLVLSSPSFLYLLEPSEAEGSAPLSDRELAARLSYFLWSGPPDAELLALAQAGKLSDPRTLSAQVDRLLTDARSRRFIEAFVHQWLDMERLDMFDFHSQHHPTFDESVRRSARQEVYATFAHLLRNDLPLQTLLDADFVLVNDVLGLHYGLNQANSPIVGPEFRPIPVPVGAPRGGLLGMAAIHVMGSDGQRSSPVERGAWVLRHVLNDPPPPAPANVPMLSRIEETRSARDLQLLHQEEPQCAQCHEKIDPIGYGLENFDAAGLWREREVIKNYKFNERRSTESFEIDPAGQLPNGQSFRDFFGLRETVATRQNAFAKGFTEHLISYALGRPYSFSDEQLAHDLCEGAAGEDYNIKQFVHALVQSKAFRTK